MAWWKQRGKTSSRVEHDAAQFIQAHGERAEEAARLAARIARDRHNRNQGRHYSHVALRIEELKHSGGKWT